MQPEGWCFNWYTFRTYNQVAGHTHPKFFGNGVTRNGRQQAEEDNSASRANSPRKAGSRRIVPPSRHLLSHRGPPRCCTRSRAAPFRSATNVWAAAVFFNHRRRNCYNILVQIPGTLRILARWFRHPKWTTHKQSAPPESKADPNLACELEVRRGLPDEPLRLSR